MNMSDDECLDKSIVIMKNIRTELRKRRRMILHARLLLAELVSASKYMPMEEDSPT